jgi:hypothetical protein
LVQVLYYYIFFFFGGWGLGSYVLINLHLPTVYTVINWKCTKECGNHFKIYYSESEPTCDSVWLWSRLDATVVMLIPPQKLQILCFWTLSVILFLYKTRFGDWILKIETEYSLWNTMFEIKTGRCIMSRNIKFVAMYWCHQLLDLILRN